MIKTPTQGLLNGYEIQDILERGYIKNSDSSLINASSLDVRLGGNFLVEEMGPHTNEGRRQCATLIKKDSAYPIMKSVKGSVRLAPREFCLAETVEEFNLPDDISCFFKLKSTSARRGLQHALAGWVDAGFHGSVLTLELSNSLRYHDFLLSEGDKVGQLLFFRHENAGAFSYRNQGSYNNSKTVRKGE